MKKTLKITELDCANCAAKIEKNINKLEGVQAASVSFITKKILLEYADDVNETELFKQIEAQVKRVEPDCDLIV